MSQLFQLRTRFLPALILLAGLLPSAWLLFELRDLPQLGLIGDDVMYVGAAHSLAHDGTYREYALPGDPWQTKYPPGYPLLLAAILTWDPPHLIFARFSSWIWLCGRVIHHSDRYLITPTFGYRDINGAKAHFAEQGPRSNSAKVVT